VGLGSSSFSSSLCFFFERPSVHPLFNQFRISSHKLFGELCLSRRPLLVFSPQFDPAFIWDPPRRSPCRFMGVFSLGFSPRIFQVVRASLTLPSFVVLVGIHPGPPLSQVVAPLSPLFFSGPRLLFFRETTSSCAVKRCFRRWLLKPA